MYKSQVLLTKFNPTQISNLKQILSTSAPFRICIWGDSIRRPSHFKFVCESEIAHCVIVCHFKFDIYNYNRIEN